MQALAFGCRYVSSKKTKMLVSIQYPWVKLCYLQLPRADANTNKSTKQRRKASFGLVFNTSEVCVHKHSIYKGICLRVDKGVREIGENGENNKNGLGYWQCWGMCTTDEHGENSLGLWLGCRVFTPRDISENGENGLGL